MNALCQCGCGTPVRLAPVNDRSKGWVKGQPLKFIKGHGVGAAAQIKAAAALGTKTISTHGYVLVNVGPRQRQYEHIQIAERALGRPLRSFGPGHPLTEVVHHIDGDKTNNAPSNLLICTHRYHTELHHRLEQSQAWPEFPRITRNQGSRHV